MSKNILVMGGTRFFGKLLVQRLLDADNKVTIATRGKTPDDFGPDVQRIIVDRQNETSMLTAFKGKADYDLVYDQMCYTPLDASISVKVFSGRVGRYIMSSTIEAYDNLQGKVLRPFKEQDIDLAQLPVDLTFPWRGQDLAAHHYGAGKRQAEAYFLQDGRLPVVSVRIAHVLGGPEDFTGRLAAYVRRVAQNETLRYSTAQGGSSFISAEAISDFLCWIGGAHFVGPINCASGGFLSALDIFQRAAILLDKPVTTTAINGQNKPGELSPFDYPFPYSMDISRARSLGYAFSDCNDWLDKLILQHAKMH